MAWYNVRVEGVRGILFSPTNSRCFTGCPDSLDKSLANRKATAFCLELEMKQHRRRIAQGKRDEIMAQTSGACYYCGYAATCLDHIRPHSYIANDDERNLVPSCDICNLIAGNKHFDSLHAKKEYILAERDSLKWRRRIARMTVMVIQVEQPTPPTTKPKPVINKPPKPIVKKERIQRKLENKPQAPPKPKPIIAKQAPPAPPQWSYVEDDLDYIQGLVEEVIENIDDLTDEQADDLMSALISRGENLLYKDLFEKLALIWAGMRQSD